ncbi:MAG TPA: winged helix-turn-helix domain-containing protein [Bryobacteraceae bacterium]|nr:winged helix-turn-helix domain-containing protein [Bryobacteraceae bacterium]
MTSPNQPPVRLTFGPFEVNTSTGELLKGGTRVRLPAQPFAILLLLLKNPGELVTREQLRERIWREGTFVDFEHGLNAAMNKLRSALGDSAETHATSKPCPAAVTVLSECWTPGTSCQFPFAPSRRLAKSVHGGGGA